VNHSINAAFVELISFEKILSIQTIIINEIDINLTRAFLFSRCLRITRIVLCMYFQSSREVRGYDFFYRGSWFEWTTEMTISFITKVGVYFISPSLSFRTVVLFDSSAFAALNKIDGFSSFEFSRELSNVLDLLLRQLQDVFRSRAASLYDVDVNENIILHVNISNVWWVKAVDTLQRMCDKIKYDVKSMNDVEVFDRFLNELQLWEISHNMINALRRCLKFLQWFSQSWSAN
jgi:hypothetical protein